MIHAQRNVKLKIIVCGMILWRYVHRKYILWIFL